MGSAAMVGWVLSRMPEKKQKLYVFSSEKSHQNRMGKAVRDKNRKDQPNILSLGIELLAAVGLKLLKRNLKSWSSTLIWTLKNPPKSRSSSRGVPSKTAPKDFSDLYDQRSEIPPEKFEADKPYPKGIVELFKNTASEWIEDKCPQLGAALAYYTVFSLEDV
jgi:hypothetical protein